MLSGSMRVAKRGASRFLSRVLPWFLALGLAQTAIAQQPTPLSPSVVLVLKLVSSTLVKPATGIVIADNGLVLVPAEFAAAEGEMIVLDGGTDILSNGRPAKIVAQAVPGELAMLSVEGLKRPGITLSGNALDEGNGLHLEAFPPAEYIAKGAQPLWIPVDVLRGEHDLRTLVSAATPLPYVSGAIIDTCGYLAGVSISSGAQSLETVKPTLTLFTTELSRVFDSMQISLPVANCMLPAQVAETPAATAMDEEVPVHKANKQQPAAQASEDHSLEGKTVEPATPAPQDTGPIQDSAQGNVTDLQQQVNATPPQPASIWHSIPLWLPLLGVLVLAVFIWKGFFFFRLGKHTRAQTAVTNFTRDVQPASDEPVTAPLETSSAGSPVKPRAAPVFATEFPEPGERPAGCDGVLLVEGLLDADTAFKRFCFVNTAQIDIIIGRGDADIAIEHAAISRAHARVVSDGSSLTLTDLGSRNGSFIGDVPCLPGEILYFETDDEIILGDVKLSVRVVRQEAEWA